MAIACLALGPALAQAPAPAMKPPPPGSAPMVKPEPEPTPSSESEPSAPQPMRPSDSGPMLELVFQPGVVELDAEIRAKLAGIAAKAKSDESRMQIKSFASGGQTSSSEVRRVSLKRALAVRSYLIDEGVRSTRIDVRALGAPLDDGPQDRVELILLEQ